MYWLHLYILHLRTTLFRSVLRRCTCWGGDATDGGPYLQYSCPFPCDSSDVCLVPVLVPGAMLWPLAMLLLPPCPRWLPPPLPLVPGVIIGVEICRIPLRLVHGNSSTSWDGYSRRVSVSLELPLVSSATWRPVAGGLLSPPGKIRVSGMAGGNYTEYIGSSHC